MMNLPELGVGVIFFPGLETLLEAGKDIIDVIEIEPQPFWFKSAGPDGSYRIDARALDHIVVYPQHKIVHGVGRPVGSTLPLDDGQRTPFVDTITWLRAPWASEHLSFLKARRGDEVFNTGFLLPPLQTPAAVAVAAAQIRELRAQLPVPLAFETGVNYLRPLPGEMSDGSFFCAIAEAADCGILLDLHNLWSNQLNGRQPVREALDEMPLERVWEVHLAGGDRFQGYWLDAHSGLVPSALMELASEIIPRLPNLKALIFEIITDYIPAKKIRVDHLLDQIEDMRKLWARRHRGARGARVARTGALGPPKPSPAVGELPLPAAWEAALGALVIGRSPEQGLESQLAKDPGVALMRQLVANVRAGMVVELLKLTYRLLVLHIGEPRVHDLLKAFWKLTPPETFASVEAQNFADYLRSQSLTVPHLREVLAFELLSQQVLMEGQAKTMRFGCDPMPLLRALGEGHLPNVVTEGEFELTIRP